MGVEDIHPFDNTVAQLGGIPLVGGSAAGRLVRDPSMRHNTVYTVAVNSKLGVLPPKEDFGEEAIPFLRTEDYLRTRITPDVLCFVHAPLHAQGSAAVTLHILANYRPE